MWEFRRDPGDLTDAEKADLEGLFAVLPRLRVLHDIRVRFRAVFETAADREGARRGFDRVFLTMLDEFPAMDAFIATFERWEEPILNDFVGRQTSGPVEGINNKARVIVKRAYGLKCAGSLWTRLVLDLNRAADVVTHTVERIHQLVAEFRAIFA